MQERWLEEPQYGEIKLRSWRKIKKTGFHESDHMLVLKKVT